MDQKEKQPAINHNDHTEHFNKSHNDAEGHGPLSEYGSYVATPVISAQVSRRLN
jgi:hypothetical protein